MARRMRRLILAALAVYLPVSATPATAQIENTWPLGPIIGNDVLGSDGDKVGEVHDVVFDVSGRLSSIVVEDSGFLWWGGDFLEIAWPTIGWSPRDNAVYLPMRRKVAEQAPMVDENWRAAFIEPQEVTARQVLGLPVRRPTGMTYAEVEELLFDPLIGHIAVAVLKPLGLPETALRYLAWHPRWFDEQRTSLTVPADIVEIAGPPEIAR